MSILFATTIKGVLYILRIFKASKVCGLKPSLISTINTAKSANAPPRFLKLVNAACPGVSIKNKPGIKSLIASFEIKLPQISSIVSLGISVAPIC